MAGSFDVQVIGEGAVRAELIGPDIDDAILFIRLANGVARFDLEFDGRMFRDCHLSGMLTGASIAFSFERSGNVEANSAPDSTPPTSNSCTPVGLLSDLGDQRGRS